MNPGVSSSFHRRPWSFHDIYIDWTMDNLTRLTCRCSKWQSFRQLWTDWQPPLVPWWSEPASHWWRWWRLPPWEICRLDCQLRYLSPPAAASDPAERDKIEESPAMLWPDLDRVLESHTPLLPKRRSLESESHCLYLSSPPVSTHLQLQLSGTGLTWARASYSF